MPAKQWNFRYWPKANMRWCNANVRFSNRPFGVKHFQTIHHCSVDVADGLALLFGIGTKALPSWDPRTRRNNLLGGLAVKRTVGPSGHANSPHPSSRKGHLSTARWNSGFLLSDLIFHGCHAAAVSCSRAHSLATFTSRTILPESSTMQTLVSLTETSNPAKCSMLRFSF